METSKDIKGQGAIMAFFGINMSKNENPSKQNVILVVVKATLIYFTF
jgi:flagellar basal body P-ring protein FlgI